MWTHSTFCPVGPGGPPAKCSARATTERTTRLSEAPEHALLLTSTLAGPVTLVFGRTSVTGPAGSVYRCGTGRGNCAARTRHTPPRMLLGKSLLESATLWIEGRITLGWLLLPGDQTTFPTASPRGRKTRRVRAFPRFLPPWRSCVTAVEWRGARYVFVTRKPRARCARRRRSATLAPCPTPHPPCQPPPPATTAGGPSLRRPIATSTTWTRGRACSASVAGTPATAPHGGA